MQDDDRIEQHTSSPVLSHSSFQVASRWRRMLASVIDTFIISVSLLILGNIYREDIADLGSLAMLFGILAITLYFGLFDSRLGDGRTPGKRALNIQTMGLDGALLSPATAAWRSLTFYGPFFLTKIEIGKGTLNEVEKLLFFSGVLLAAGLIYFFFLNTYHRSVHDMVTGTLVVRRASQVPPSVPPIWSGHIAGFILFALVLSAPFSGKVPFLNANSPAKRIIDRLEAYPEVRSVEASLQRHKLLTSEQTVERVWLQVDLEVNDLASTEPTEADVRRVLRANLEQVPKNLPITVVKTRIANLGLVTLQTKIVSTNGSTNASTPNI